MILYKHTFHIVHVTPCNKMIIETNIHLHSLLALNNYKLHVYIYIYIYVLKGRVYA